MNLSRIIFPCAQQDGRGVRPWVACLAQAILDQVQKFLVDARVGGQFRMKGCGERASLADDDRIRAFGGENFDTFTDMDNFGRADEDHF